MDGFMEIYKDGGTSVMDAAEKMRTSQVTARTYWLKCADIIAEANYVKNETWLAKRDRVIDRAMEAYTKRKNEAISSKIRIGYMLAIEYKKHAELATRGKKLTLELTKLEESIKSATTKDKQMYKIRANLLKMYYVDQETFKATISQISYLEKQFLEIQQVITDLQEKYDAMDARPPASQILQSELEVYLDKKNEIKSVANTR